jgi:hypothetical protein
VSAAQSAHLSRRGEFRSLYRALDRRHLLASTPVIYCEGDSWFSTPLAMNLLDWLVSPAPEDAEKGVPLFGTGGLFFRTERSGDSASPQFAKPGRAMFTEKRLEDLVGWFKGFDFDLVLLSAGGNDLADRYLRETFGSLHGSNLSPEQAFDVVADSGRYRQVRDAYRRCITTFGDARPEVRILAHTYAYPRLVGHAGDLTVGNVGVAAVLRKSVGPWIGPHVAPALAMDPANDGDELRQFVRLLVDGFESEVLRALRDEFGAGCFDYVDLRHLLPRDADWFDEMHPTEEGFHTLAGVMRAKVIEALPVAKR